MSRCRAARSCAPSPLDLSWTTGRGGSARRDGGTSPAIARWLAARIARVHISLGMDAVSRRQRARSVRIGNPLLSAARRGATLAPAQVLVRILHVAAQLL